MERSIHERFFETPENQRLYQQEKLLVEVTELLAEVMDKKKVNRAELGRVIGKSKAFVSQVLSGNHNMTLRTVADLFGALRCEVILRALPYSRDEEAVPTMRRTQGAISVSAAVPISRLARVIRPRAHPHKASASRRADRHAGPAPRTPPAPAGVFGIRRKA